MISIISSMALRIYKSRRRCNHDGKIYKTMKSVGVWNLVLGIIFILSGLAAGTFLIVNGAKLLKKNQISCSDYKY